MQVIQESDYNFVRQAIRDRAEAMIKHLCPVIDMFAEPDDLPDDQISVKKIDLVPPVVKAADNIKDLNAPWGYKKDGTPRARPGRPAKRRASKRK